MNNKEKLLRLVQECNNEEIIEAAIDLFENPSEDWWDELSQEEQHELLEAEEQGEEGDFISHEELMKQTAEWLKQRKLTGEAKQP